MHQSPDISICIPTRNRAALLRRCLSHLLTFSSIKIEVVIGDNASADDIKDVVTAYEKQFTHFSYLRHPTDIGVVRNVSSILRRAQAPYAYILSDDDIVFENGLALLKAMLDGSPELAAAGGKYVGTDTPPTIGLNVDYGATTHFRIARGDHLTLVDNFLLADGYPLLRTEMFRRHCIDHERGFGLFPLFAQLLTHGDIAFVDQPIFQHFQNRESLSTKMPESWFHDFYNADIEIAFANLAEPLPAERLERLRRHFHQITYFQSARMCRIRQHFPLMWHFLIRAKAVGGVSDGCLVQCERMFLLDVTLRRICRMIEDAGAKAVRVENTTLLLPLKARLQDMLPAVEFFASETGADAEASDIYLVENFEPARSTSSDAPTVIAFRDVLTAMRLTRHAAETIADDNSIKITVLASQSPAPDFKILMADYGRPANKEALVAEALTRKPLQRFPERSQAPSTPLDNAVGRNQSCPCGSGKKYKHCHGQYV